MSDFLKSTVVIFGHRSFFAGWAVLSIIGCLEASLPIRCQWQPPSVVKIKTQKSPVVATCLIGSKWLPGKNHWIR